MGDTPRGRPPARDEFLAKSGIDIGHLIKQNPHSWIYDGDLKPTGPVRVLTGLIVKGDCILPEGSVIERDIKAKESLSIGAHTVCRGNAIADGDLTIGPSARFHKVVHSGGTLRILAGAVGGDPANLAAAIASENLLLSENVIIHGKVAAADRVIVES